MEQSVIDQAVAFLLPMAPIVKTIFMGLGLLTVIGLTVDSLLDDKIDGGFMKKIMTIPVLGAVLKTMTKFSPMNYKEVAPEAKKEEVK